jgi:CHASE domain
MSNKNVENIFLSIKTLSNLFPSAAHQAGREVPFVTVEDFEAVGDGTRKVSKASIIAFVPLLHTDTDLKLWHSFSINNTFWIPEGRSIASSLVNGSRVDSEHELHADQTAGVPERVYRLDKAGRQIPEFGKELYAPLWQMTPVPADLSVVNFNLASNEVFAEILHNVLARKKEVLSKLVEAKTLFGQAASTSGDRNPSSLLVQPVFDDLIPGADRPVTGVVAALIPWKDFFDGVSARNVQSDHAFISAQCFNVCCLRAGPTRQRHRWHLCCCRYLRTKQHV